MEGIWLLVVALPLWRAGEMDADTVGAAYECLMAVVFLIVIPWRYVIANYVVRPADGWR